MSQCEIQSSGYGLRSLLEDAGRTTRGGFTGRIAQPTVRRTFSGTAPLA